MATQPVMSPESLGSVGGPSAGTIDKHKGRCKHSGNDGRTQYDGTHRIVHPGRNHKVADQFRRTLSCDVENERTGRHQRGKQELANGLTILHSAAPPLIVADKEAVRPGTRLPNPRAPLG